MSETRTGIGYDIHRLVEGRRLVLGGIEIPFEKGLTGHSDSDVLTHAICDALLGAAALGDIGRHFPDKDPDFKGASSLDLLAAAMQLIKSKGFLVNNVDVVVIAEQPRLAPHVDGMREKLAKALETDADRISIKAKTNEGVGGVGSGEAIAAFAVAVLTKT